MQSIKEEYEKALDLFYEHFGNYPLMEWNRSEEDYHTEKFIALLYKAIKENDKTIAENTFEDPPEDVIL